jgi:hypothetical protein
VIATEGDEPINAEYASIGIGFSPRVFTLNFVGRSALERVSIPVNCAGKNTCSSSFGHIFDAFEMENINHTRPYARPFRFMRASSRSILLWTHRTAGVMLTKLYTYLHSISGNFCSLVSMLLVEM